VPSGATTITGARWTFGDGTGAEGTTARHRWDRPGTFTVGVTARLRHGQMARAATRVVVASPDGPPRIVRLAVEPDEPRVGRQVRFSAELTGGRPQSRTWVVTGAAGTVAGSTAASFTHVFTAPGTYTATLTVRGRGEPATKSARFTVLPAAREVTCGAIITTDAVLSADLMCPDDVGLTIAASDVVLDLGGHTLYTDDPLAERKGVRVAAGRTVENVVIRDGTISEFHTAIDMTDVAGLTIDNLTVSTSPEDETYVFGIVGDRAVDVRIQGLTQTGFHLFRFVGGSSVTILGSTISGWGLSECATGSTCVLRDSSFEASVFGCFGEGDSSLLLEDMARIAVEQLGSGCRSATVTGNELVAMLGGLYAEDNTVVGNDFYENINVFPYGDSLISGNNFYRSSGLGMKIETTARVDVIGNKFIDSGSCGLLVTPFDGPGGHPIGPLRISGNEFTSNGFGSDTGDDCRDGLRVEGMLPGDDVWISGNHARGNAGRGFNVDPDAVAAGIVVDGGGNTSAGDGDECLGITC
jgi:PKD repeat protein